MHRISDHWPISGKPAMQCSAILFQKYKFLTLSAENKPQPFLKENFASIKNNDKQQPPFLATNYFIMKQKNNFES